MATARIDASSSIELLVEMCIGTDRGSWWADPEFGSDLWLIRQYGKVGPGTAAQVKRAIEAALAWLVADGLAQAITVVAEQVGRTAIAWTVVVTKPGGRTALVKDVWNGISAA